MSKLKPINRWLRLLIVLSGVLTLLGGSYGAWQYYNVPPMQRYEPLLRQIADHHLTGDDRGQIDLSKTYPGLTPKDLAYVRWRDDGSFVAMFPTYYGQGAQLAGLIYSSRPLREEDTHQHIHPTDLAERLIGVGTYDQLVLEKQINPSWYHVSYHMH